MLVWSALLVFSHSHPENRGVLVEHLACGSNIKAYRLRTCGGVASENWRCVFLLLLVRVALKLSETPGFNDTGIPLTTDVRF